MAFFDLPDEQLRTYLPRVLEAGDFDEFWIDTIRTSQARSKRPVFTPVGSHLPNIEAYDLEFAGFEGQRIKAWYILPVKKLRGKEKIPCIMVFVGYGGGRSELEDWTMWPAAGCAVLVMDTRGQGANWSSGSTPDQDPQPLHPQFPGFLTRGILSPWNYYYRRVFTDAVRAFQTIAARTEIDPAKIMLSGDSQGAGIALATSGILHSLSADVKAEVDDRLPLGIMPSVPFLCHFRRASEITNSLPYAEINGFLRSHTGLEDSVFGTLSYFDGVVFAKRSRCPALFSVALMDQVCPPSTVYAAYNHYAGKQKNIEVYRYNGHEGGGIHHERKRIEFVKKLTTTV